MTNARAFSTFRYDEAFSRNIGWLTPNEQEFLASRRIAIAGAGGVGGSHLLTLTRLGVGAFNIADFDVFELANFNRQIGADIQTVGRPKVEVLADKALSINPHLNLTCFEDGITPENIHKFLEDVDLYVDGLDFFAFDARALVFDECYRRGIPAITAAPLGFSTAVLIFMPGAMTFEEYFGFAGKSVDEKALRFLVGLAPKATHSDYLVWPSALNLNAKRGPSTGAACEMCAGVTAAQAAKILLRRPGVKTAPHAFQYDGYSNRIAHTWRPGGNSHPLNKLRLQLASQALAQKSEATTSAKSPSQETPRTPSVIEQILDLARWAPSGDNMQSWKFRIIDDSSVIIHCRDTRNHCVYDLQGHATEIALGALLETIGIAASKFRLEAQFSAVTSHDPTDHLIRVDFTNDQNVTTSELFPYIKIRTTQRRPMPGRTLTTSERELLSSAVPKPFKVVFFEKLSERFSIARLLFDNAEIRLTIPEAYLTHRSIIDWGKRFSEDKIPDQAVGLDPAALQLMRWAMQDWSRVSRLNRFFAGTLAPRIQLDFLPGLFCSAHFLICAEPEHLPDENIYIGAGRAWQRFWLTATKLGIWLQPEMTPLIFSEYARNAVGFSKTSKAIQQAHKLTAQWESLLGKDVFSSAIVMGRVGFGPAPHSRSLRLPLESLILRDLDS